MKNNEKDNNFRTLSGSSEKQGRMNDKRVADTYADVLSGNNGHPVRSESSYDDTGLTGSQEALGLTGSAGMNTSVGAYGNRGMTDLSDAFTNVGGMGNNEIPDKTVVGKEKM